MRRFASPLPLALAVALGLSGCATSGEDAGDAQSLSERWKGKPAETFFARHGSAFAEYGERGGGVRYTWRKRYTMSSANGAAAEVRVCEIDLLADAADRIQSIVATRNSKIRDDETPSCEGALDLAGAG
ncbi:hypothetical protein U0C82_13295 [Fulvimarina sp. 2208YS6-2-32]|uniref:Lipoprotein n=1 Tax=Fulvimarina uroteuthidis TaxID=3098149 RepID=A0ABU5I3Z9_9HYPH|nr:hypothetical protein [Fulvimarina sp. 2208YS6-2-32]MDY8110116.1 hypothetical protein [Fulvimarina sp. 2208YS6-2-32]